jgi:hypothetical protein
MSASDTINIEAGEQRAHEFALARLIVRGVALTVGLIVGAATYSCDRTYHSRLADAEERQAAAEAGWSECRRWTP